MEKQTKVLIVILAIVVALIVVVAFRSMPSPTDWKPDVELHNPGILQIYQNGTQWIVDLPISYNRTCFADHESHSCIYVQYEVRVEFTEGEDESYYSDYILLKNPPEGMQHTNLIVIPYETRQPTNAYLVDVHCA